MNANSNKTPAAAPAARIRVEIQAIPCSKKHEKFLFMLKEVLGFQEGSSFGNLKAFLAREYSDDFFVYIGGSHIAVHDSPNSSRILFITEVA